MKVRTKNMVKHGGQYHPTGTVLDVSIGTATYLFGLDAAEPAEGVSELTSAMTSAKAPGDERTSEFDEQNGGGDEQNPVGDPSTDISGEGDAVEGETGEGDGPSEGDTGEGDAVEGGASQGSGTDPVPDDLVMAAQGAIAQGKVTKDGRPSVEAMEAILGRDITAADRDTVWEAIKPAEEQMPTFKEQSQTDLDTVFFNPSEHAVLATYTPSGGAAVENVPAIFNLGQGDEFRGADSFGVRATIWIQVSDVAQVDSKDTLLIDGDTWQVIDADKDLDGLMWIAQANKVTP